jgi:hypothetical protein
MPLVSIIHILKVSNTIINRSSNNPQNHSNYEVLWRTCYPVPRQHCYGSLRQRSLQDEQRLQD